MTEWIPSHQDNWYCYCWNVDVIFRKCNQKKRIALVEIFFQIAIAFNHCRRVKINKNYSGDTGILKIFHTLYHLILPSLIQLGTDELEILPP